MQRHDPEVQEKLKRIDVVLRWLILGGHLELGDGRYMLDEDGSLIFQHLASIPEEHAWYSVENMSVNYFFKKCIELSESKIFELKADLALNSNPVKPRKLKSEGGIK
jgi:hypothetical protein